MPFTKQSMRDSIISIRNNIDVITHERRSLIICLKVYDVLHSRRLLNANIAIYKPFRNEVSMQYLEQNIVLKSYPSTSESENERMVFKRSDKGFIKNKLGFEEPEDNNETVIPDVIVVPILGFDSFCYRLGYGKGCYDKYLDSQPRRRKILTIGAAFDCQRIDILPKENHDKKLDFIVTEKCIYS